MDGCKVFNDPVHGHIEIPYLAVRLIDTAQFQRLRNIRQLGTTNFVFHGASHSRFEHSIGVCHLAGELVQLLMIKQPELGITAAEVLCVQIAGLCHDLGHGPWSHTFETFMNRSRPELGWRHEHASVQMFHHMIQQNNLMPVFGQCGLTEEHVQFIAHLINPDFEESPFENSPRQFLNEIVNNKYSGMDVDKWDYFARDCYYLNLGTLFDYRRFLKYARVVDVNGQLHISTREKEVAAVHDLYTTRTMLHRRAYQHPVAKTVEIMIVDALLLANDYIHLEAAGKKYRISECVDDMNAFQLLDDRIIYLIRISTDPNLKPAKELVNRIDNRAFYKFVGVALSKDPKMWKKCECGWATEKSEIAMGICQQTSTGKVKLKPENLFVEAYIIQCGNDGNPCSFMYFYNKRQINTHVPISQNQIYCVYPSAAPEQHIIVFCREEDHVLPACRQFTEWCSNNGFSLLKLNPCATES